MIGNDIPPGASDITPHVDRMADDARYRRAEKQRRGQTNGATEQPPLRFTLVPFRDIKLDTGNNYLVKKLIPREGLIVVWGPPKCGKSFWVYDLVMHIACDRSYRGRRVTSGPVVYVACEGERGLAARTAAYRKWHLIDDSENPNFYLVNSRLDLVAEHTVLVADIRRQIGNIQPVAIIIDTLNRSIRGSESTDEDMGAYVKAIDAVREAFKCAVIVIHHCGIDDKRPRGHTSLTGAADAQIAIKRTAEGLITATLEYMKDGSEGEEVHSRLQVVEVGLDADDEPITSCIIEEAESEHLPKSAKVTGQAKLALDLLKKALADSGQPAPESRFIPRTKTVVLLDVWECYCKSGLLAESDKPDTIRKAMKRAADKLQSSGIIDVWDNLVWLADKSDKSTQART